MSDGTQLIRYDAMCRAIAEAHAVDEVKDIRDKAMALEEYARRARNTEAERQCVDIRIRAEIRAGELLGEQLRHGGDRRSESRSHDVTLNDLGISKKQSSDWQRLAAIPAQEREADLADPMWRPTTSGLLERHEAREREIGEIWEQQPRGDDNALWLWGVLIDFQDRGLLEREPCELIATPMNAHMRTTLRKLAPQIGEWLGRIA